MRLPACALAVLCCAAVPPAATAAEPSPVATGSLLPLQPGPPLVALAIRPALAVPPSTAGECTPRIDDTSALTAIDQHNLPADQFVMPGAAVERRHAAARIRADQPILELAARSYAEPGRPGSAVLRQDLGWQVLEHADSALRLLALAGRTTRTADEVAGSGFRAVSYVNRQSKRIVIAIAGSDFTDSGDIRNDATALRGGRLPQQFEIARDYARDIRQRYGATHAISCTGHSLGGGACAYAAVTLGLPAITFNPIASMLPHRVCHHHLARVDNYVMANDIAFTAYTRAGRHLLGSIYRIRAPLRDFFVEYGAVKSWRIDRVVARTAAWVFRLQAHKLSAGLDRLAREAGTSRPLRQPTLEPHRQPTIAAPALTPLGASGLCWTGKQAVACELASIR